MNNYIVLPRISDQELLVKYYSAADAFIICSKQDNFPTTCVEAQCCGARVFGFDVGGVRETSVLDSDDFVDYGDIEALAHKIRNLSPVYNLKELAENRYAKKNMLNEYLAIYDKQKRSNRILQINVVCKELSTGKIAYDLFEGIKQDGREAAICYGRGKSIHEANIHKTSYDLETLLHAGLTRITGYNGFFSDYSTNNLIREIDIFNPDLIHLHEIHGYYVNIEKLITYIKKKEIPVVWTFHCEYMFTGKCGYSYNCTRYTKGCGNCPALRDYPKSLFFDRTSSMIQKKKNLLKDFDFTIVTPSQWLADKVKLSFLRAKDTHVIHNGIDTDIFKQNSDKKKLKQELRLPENKKIVLSVAVDIMSERKGGKHVVKLAELMKNDDTYFVLIGDN